MITYNDYEEVFEIGRRKLEAPVSLVVCTLSIPLGVFFVLAIVSWSVPGLGALVLPLFIWCAVVVGFFLWWGISAWVRVFLGD